MKEKRTLWVVIVLLIVLVLIWLLAKNQDTEQKTNLPEQDQQELVLNNIEVVYSDGDVELHALFNNNERTVSFNLDEVGDVILASTISASGARYANEDETLVFWEHQGEATVTLNEEVIYTGTVVSSTEIESEGNSFDESLEAVLPLDHPILESWAFDSAFNTEGNEIEFNQKNAFTLNFTAEGMANGTTDCNNYFGPFQVGETDELTFGPLASTMMYCEGSQESTFTGLLANTNSYQVEANKLVLKLGDGSTMNFNK